MESAKQSAAAAPAVVSVADVGIDAVRDLTDRYQLELVRVPVQEPIPGSFWGAPEAGIIGSRIYVRDDTPLHSFLHELSHIICMDPGRRASLDRDAGSDDAEESAVCYLQIVIADELDGVGRLQVMQDMDAWGYSFRLGSTRRWFEEDAADARLWLYQFALLSPAGHAGFRLRNQSVIARQALSLATRRATGL